VCSSDLDKLLEMPVAEEMQMGISIGLAVIMGIVAIGGSVIPLAVDYPEKLFELPGFVLLGGILIMIAGLYICAKAGLLKDKDQNTGAEKQEATSTKIDFKKGLLICIIAGLLSSLMNFGIIYGKPISVEAIRLGANPANAGNAGMALVFTSNFLVNVIYCIYLLRKNKTFKNYSLKGTFPYWIMVAVMGALWSGSVAIYGAGTSKIGDLAAYLGFPVLMIIGIIAGNIFGVLTGEWASVGLKPKKTMIVGILTLILAIIIINIKKAKQKKKQTELAEHPAPHSL
jgi:L-rhamnose-H+ transport protein